MPPVGMMDWVDDLKALVDELGLNKFYLAGTLWADRSAGVLYRNLAIGSSI